MKLSIIIRCWNRLEYTIRTIVSIHKNSGLKISDYEIICIDQGSTDGTIEWLKANYKEGFYPLVPVFLDNNVGDGKGMQEGIQFAKGEFVAQHDNDLEVLSSHYFSSLIDAYEVLEQNSRKVCVVGASHAQGIIEGTAAWNFGLKRYSDNSLSLGKGKIVFILSWITGSFIFRKGFITKAFHSGMCNSWCSYWWDHGYDNFLCSWIKYWHMDSSKEGGEYVKVQAQKFPSYKYVTRHYGKFV